jgi:hypothetical protein
LNKSRTIKIRNAILTFQLKLFPQQPTFFRGTLWAKKSFSWHFYGSAFSPEIFFEKTFFIFIKPRNMQLGGKRQNCIFTVYSKLEPWGIRHFREIM